MQQYHQQTPTWLVQFISSVLKTHNEKQTWPEKRTQMHTCSGFSLNKLNVSLFWMKHLFKSSLFVKDYMVFTQITELAMYYAKCPKRTLETHQYHHSCFLLTQPVENNQILIDPTPAQHHCVAWQDCREHNSWTRD